MCFATNSTYILLDVSTRQELNTMLEYAPADKIKAKQSQNDPQIRVIKDGEFLVAIPSPDGTPSSLSLS